MGIREPAAYRYCVLGVEDIRCGRIIDDDCFPKVSTDLREILDVVALMVVATFSE
jgi:hypothetical protein